MGENYGEFVAAAAADKEAGGDESAQLFCLQFNQLDGKVKASDATKSPATPQLIESLQEHLREAEKLLVELPSYDRGFDADSSDDKEPKLALAETRKAEGLSHEHVPSKTKEILWSMLFDSVGLGLALALEELSRHEETLEVWKKVVDWSVAARQKAGRS